MVKAKWLTLGLIAAALACKAKTGSEPQTAPETSMRMDAVVKQVDHGPSDVLPPDDSKNLAHAAEGTTPFVPAGPYPLLKIDAVTADPSLRQLVVTLEEPNRGKDTLKQFQDRAEGGFQALRQAARAEQENVRFQATLFLANWKGREKEAGQILCEVLSNDPKDDVRAAAARGLMMLERLDTADCLLRALEHDPYETARANSAWALGAMRCRKAVEPLKHALSDPTTWVRLRAITALRHLNATSAVAGMVSLLRDDNPMVRERAHDALKDLTGKNLPADYESWAPLARKSP